MRAMVSLLMLVAGLNPALTAAAEKPRTVLHYLGVAYDEAPPAGGTTDHYNYAPDNFADLFRAQSADLFRSVKVTTLKGNEATRAAVMRELRAIGLRAAEGDLVFVYWGTHGGTAKNDWSANLPGGDPIYGRELKSALGLLPCPVVVAISTCGSGGFVRPEVDKIELPKNVFAFAACLPHQTASNELDVSLLEAMAGFGDLDGDGIVTLRETADYVPRRYHKLKRGSAGPDTEPVVGQGKEAVLDVPLTRVTGRHVGVVYANTWYGAVVVERLDGKAKVRYLGWDPLNANGGYALPDEIVEEERIDPDGGEPALEVEWEGVWYPAKVVKRTEQGLLHIHYIGYPESDDETVPLKRVRFPFVELR